LIQKWPDAYVSGEPNNHRGLRVLSTYHRVLLLWGILFLLAASRSQAQVPLRAQRSIRPPELNVQYHRAETAWKSGNSVLEAKARIDRVIRALPDDLEARKLRAGILLSMGQPERAYADALRAARLGPKDGEAQLLLCETAVLSDRMETARQALDRAAELLLDRPAMHIRLSRCAVALGQLDKAEAFARIALAGDENNAAAYLQLARVFSIAGEDDKAVTVLEKGLRLGLLRPNEVRSDDELSGLAGNPALSALMRGR
jgi:tetratricopeptide (TPR) repeat protein